MLGADAAILFAGISWLAATSARHFAAFPVKKGKQGFKLSLARQM